MIQTKQVIAAARPIINRRRLIRDDDHLWMMKRTIICQHHTHDDEIKATRSTNSNTTTSYSLLLCLYTLHHALSQPTLNRSSLVEMVWLNAVTVNANRVWQNYTMKIAKLHTKLHKSACTVPTYNITYKRYQYSSTWSLRYGRYGSKKADFKS